MRNYDAAKITALMMVKAINFVIPSHCKAKTHVMTFKHPLKGIILVLEHNS